MFEEKISLLLRPL